MHNWIKYMQTATTSNRLNVCIVRTINYGSCICSFILACVPLQGGIWYLHLLKNILQSPWHCSLLQRVSRLWKNRKRRNRLLNVIAAETLLDSGCYNLCLICLYFKKLFFFKTIPAGVAEITSAITKPATFVLSAVFGTELTSDEVLDFVLDWLFVRLCRSLLLLLYLMVSFP